VSFDFVNGDRVLVRLPLDAGTADIVVGDAITSEGATGGFYIKVDGVSDVICGIAQEIVSSPASNGDNAVLVNTSENAFYRVTAGNGTLVEGMKMESCDVHSDGVSIDVTASATDNILIHDVRTSDSTALVSVVMSFTGVA